MIKEFKVPPYSNQFLLFVFEFLAGVQYICTGAERMKAIKNPVIV